MHCNLRPPNGEPVIFRFNWDTRAKFEVGQPIAYSVFTADTFLYAMTLSFELWP